MLVSALRLPPVLHPLPLLDRLRHLPTQRFLRTQSNWPWPRSSLTLLQLGESKADMEAVTRNKSMATAQGRLSMCVALRGEEYANPFQYPLPGKQHHQGSQQQQLQHLHVPPYALYANRVLPNFRPAIVIPPLPPFQ